MLIEIQFCQAYSGGKFSGNGGATFSSTAWVFQKKMQRFTLLNGWIKNILQSELLYHN